MQGQGRPVAVLLPGLQRLLAFLQVLFHQSSTATQQARDVTAAVCTLLVVAEL
jgi:hypothetical protein